MKKTVLVTTFASILSYQGAFATSSIQLEIGELRNSAAAVTTGTWALILNTGTSSTLPGGITVGANNVLSDSTAAAAAFTGITLSLGTVINGDTIRALGSIGDFDLGPKWATALVSFGSGQENLAYGIYWFPGLNQGQTVPVTFEVGGVFQLTPSAFATRGMLSPPDQTAGESALFSFSNTAIAVPEPSTLALSALGLAALLRRRRN